MVLHTWVQWFYTVPLVMLAGLCLTATYTDLRWRQIHNETTYGFLLLGLIFYSVPHLISDGNLIHYFTVNYSSNYSHANYLEIVGHGLPQALAGALFCGLTLLPFWFFGGIGGGDVKFATALGVFVGPHMGLQVLLVGSFVAWLFLFAHWLTRRLRLKKNSIVELPMACFFSLSTCLILACAS